MNIKRFTHLWALGLLLSFTADGGLYTYDSGTLNAAITAGDLSGYVNSYTFSGISDYDITGVTVTLNVSGGYNGAFYAYLTHDGAIAVLLNRVGEGSGASFGASGSGLSVVLSPTALNNIHTSLGSGTTGTYAPDGRNIDPLSPPSAFDAAPSGNALTIFDGSSPNGTWTLFFSDVISGSGNPTLLSWSLDITAVPEPVNVALAVFGFCVAGVGVGRRIYARAKAWSPACFVANRRKCP